MSDHCQKCGGSGRVAVHGGMFGHQECRRCDGTGEPTPEVIDALELTEFVDVEKRPVVVEARRTQIREEIDTREGTVVAEPGDVILRGVEGELYPCDPSVFAKTYRLPTDHE